MTGRIVLLGVVIFSGLFSCRDARAQDVPGLEICTAEKTMERRTSCLQSNVDFLQKTIARLSADHQQKLDAANRQIEVLKTGVVSLQKKVDEVDLRRNKEVEDQNKRPDTPTAKDAAATKAASPAKDAPAAKESIK